MVGIRSKNHNGPAGATAPCLTLFPGASTNTFSNIDTGIPVTGHFNFGSVLGARGEFVIQVVQLK